ncbi:MAG: EAL domain-containing protein [Burkholderiaceae bacterium]|nr:EAL domain-containing protein [Burkholderiaceae bacterium]
MSSRRADATAEAPAGPWARFARRHLFDYNAAATRRWLALAAAGVLAALWAAVQLGSLSWVALGQVQLGLAFVAGAALFPVHIPRTKYSIGVGDVFVFALLALHGAPAAALAAGAEGLVGAWRSSKRLTSRVSTPAAAAATTALCGLGYEALHHALLAAGWPAATAMLAALCAMSLPYFAGSTLPLLAVVAAKNGQRLSLLDWSQNYSWLAAIYLMSAAVAGVLVMNARQFGASVIVVAAAVAAAVVALIRVSLHRHEADRQAQEARIAEAEREAIASQQRFTAAFTHAAIGMAIVRPDGVVLQVNQALCTLLGRSEAELLLQPFSELLHPGDAALFRRRRESAASRNGEAISMELRCRQHGGAEIWVSLHCGRFIDPDNNLSGLIYQLHDITSRRLAEDRLHHTAHHDSLTDLANRNCFVERLDVAVEHSRTDPGERFAVMFLDLDRFKVINDSLGHLAGNELLQEVARRLAASVRPGDLVARLGGDEFAVLLEQVHAPEDAMALAQRLLETLATPLMIDGTEVQPGASIGITLSDLGYRSADEVLRDADLAMYAAKADGRHRVRLFDQSMHERIADKLRLESDLRHAIGEGQLTLVYQPLFELEPYQLSGFEALARWVHPERGPISPAVFIGLAEESGHIEALTAWVIDQAAGQLAQWQACHPRGAALDMHVNISGRDLANPALVPLVREVLLRHGLRPRCLTLEITETTLMGKLQTALNALNALRKLGVKFSIDDFGTGYSSLAYLSTLPIDSLKIDRSFVMGMSEQPQNVEIVRAVLELGRSLGKKVIAEGIETVAQLATLKAMGVPVGQGYLLSRPLRAEQVPSLFDASVTEPGQQVP